MAIKKQHGLRTHGHTSPRENRGSRQSPTYVSWAMMMSRCFYPKNISFKNYGANGIGVCERWLRFENFLADIRSAGLVASRLLRVNFAKKCRRLIDNITNYRILVK